MERTFPDYGAKLFAIEQFSKWLFRISDSSRRFVIYNSLDLHTMLELLLSAHVLNVRNNLVALRRNPHTALTFPVPTFFLLAFFQCSYIFVNSFFPSLSRSFSLRSSALALCDIFDLSMTTRNGEYLAWLNSYENPQHENTQYSDSFR